MDAAYAFTQFIVETQFEDLPKEVVDVAKKSILDTLGVGLGGSSAKEIKELYEIIAEWGGRNESTVLAFGGKFPSSHAAFVNSAMCHAPESDDTFWEAGLHPGCVVVPSAFAVSELAGGIDGKRFIASVCVANELGCRAGKATKYRRPEMIMAGWDNTALLGFFMAAAMGKLLGLDKEKMHNALGLAYMQASGNEQAIRDGALTKRMGPGFASRGGITAALMAQKGISGAKEIFETGAASYYKVYHAGYDQETLLGGLGKDFLMTGIDLKPHHCCLINFAPIDGTIKLIKEHRIKAEEIQEITVITYPHAEVVCFPEEIKKKPRSIMDAQFSMPYTVACAVVRGKAATSEFTDESIKDVALLNMAAKVKTIIDPALTSMEHATVKIKTSRGPFETTILHPYGTTGNPMSYEDVGKKFLEYASYSVRPISDKNKKEVIDRVNDLEKVKDVAEIVRLLA